MNKRLEEILQIKEVIRSLLADEKIICKLLLVYLDYKLDVQIQWK